jgi:O-antigen ligase/Tfp pilus assembly protein PilF
VRQATGSAGDRAAEGSATPLREATVSPRLARAADALALYAPAFALAVVPAAVLSIRADSTDLKRLVLAAAVGVGLAASGASRAIELPRSKAWLPLLALACANLASLAFAPHRWTAAAELWRLLVLAGLFALGMRLAARPVGREGPRRERRERHASPDPFGITLRAAAAVAGAVALCGIVQHLAADPEASAFGRRAYSTCGNPNFLAAYLVAALAVTAALFMSEGKRPAAAWGVCLAVEALCLVFTGSRGGLVGVLAAGAALGVAVVTARRRSGHEGDGVGGPGPGHGLPPRGRLARGIVLGSILLGALLVSLLLPAARGGRGGARPGKPDQSLRARVLVYRGTLGTFASRPVLGWGPGSFETVFPAFRPPEYRTVSPRPRVLGAHSEYLHLAAETGAVGLAAFAWLAWAAMVSGVRALRDSGKRSGNPRMPWLRAGTLAAAAGLLAHGAFTTALRSPAAEAFLWFSMGALAGFAPGLTLRKVRVPMAAAVPAGAAVLALYAAGAYAVTVRPLVATHYVAQAEDASREGRPEEAVELYRAAARADPSGLEPRYVLAARLAELGRLEEALAVYREIEQLSPDFAQTRFEKALIHVERRDWASAERELRRAAETGALPPIFDAERALAAIRGAAPDGEKEREVFRISERSRLHEQAWLMSRDRAELVPGLVARASGHYLAGRHALAEAMFDLALSLDPDDVTALNNLAGIYFARGDYARAAGLCERAMRADPEDARPALNLAKARLAMRDFAGAERILRELLRRKPGCTQAKEFLARTPRAGRRSGAQSPPRRPPARR